MMHIEDVLVALWFGSLFAGCAIAYFAGAKAQLKECVRYRHSGCWMNDEEWSLTADISSNRRFPRTNK